jgi:hypothetical protein
MVKRRLRRRVNEERMGALLSLPLPSVAGTGSLSQIGAAIGRLPADARRGQLQYEGVIRQRSKKTPTSIPESLYTTRSNPCVDRPIA